MFLQNGINITTHKLKELQGFLNILKKYNVKSINDLWKFYEDEFYKI